MLARCILTLLLATTTFLQAQGPQPARNPERNKPLEPFRIIGNVYYVGFTDIAIFLITTPQGHILMDTGYPEMGPDIRKNIEKLGFQATDVRIILNGHAHYDHVSGHAAMKQALGAQVWATAGDGEVMESGGRKDFRFGDELYYPAVKADRILEDREAVTVGGTTMIPYLTPGHTRGNAAWTLVAEEGGTKYDVVFAGSLTINNGVHMVNYAPYPNIARDFAWSIEVQKTLKCDVFLAPHTNFFKMADKLKRLQEGAQSNPFIDPEGYRAYVDSGEKNYLKQLQEELAAQRNLLH